MSEKFETEVATVTYIANTDIDYGNSYKDVDIMIILPSEKFSKNYDTDRLAFKLSEISTSIDEFEIDLDFDAKDNLTDWQTTVIDEVEEYLENNTRNMEVSQLADNICFKAFDHYSEELMNKIINK